MLMESQVKFCSPQNISGASQQNSVAAFSETTEVEWDLLENVKTDKNIQWQTFNGSWDPTLIRKDFIYTLDMRPSSCTHNAAAMRNSP